MKSACIYMECPITKMVLAVSRKDDPNAWGLPGGKLEPGQDEVEAAREELKQETGIVLYAEWGGTCKPIEIYRRDDSVTFRVNPSWIFNIVDRAPGETGRVAWVHIEDLLNGPFSDYNRKLLKIIGRI
jgi:8-oxo-dGTP pyrophosphatase MutT (NUDIX family)